MKLSLMEKLACPMDKHDLELKIFVQDTEDNIIEGLLTCSHCKRHYPIIYGIPILSPDEYREPALEAPIVARWQQLLQ
jgi:uncharacterized protein